jgi:Cu(I)/Ag(I) efflux system membrane protein CusA/SilA
MRLLGMNSNLMSLGGIAIAIGAMVDAAIVMIENAHKHLERLPEEHTKDRADAMIDACKEVGPALFFSLLIITVSFLPVFTLESQEGRLFSPLAYTKTFAMAGAALLSVTLVPVLMMLFIRGKIMPEARNPVNRFLIWVYRPIIAAVMRWKKLTIALALVAGRVVLPGVQLGSEFMPTLNEGTLLYMPASLPGMSITKAAEVLQTQDKIIKSFPEVASVYGKAGRANTATDPAPTEMFETVINLKPQEHGARHDHRQADRRDGQGAAVPRRVQRLDHADQGAHRHAVHRHPHADRHQGLRQGPGRDGEAGQGDRGRGQAGAGNDLGLRRTPDRRQLPQHRARPRATGALRPGGGRVAGRHRHGTGRRDGHHHRRRPRALWRHGALPARAAQQPEQIEREVLVPIMGGAMVPLGQVAKVVVARGTPGIRTENALLSAYIFVDIRDRDIGSYVADARKAVNDQVKFPPGYYITWSGQFEAMERAVEKMKIVIPVTCC